MIAALRFLFRCSSLLPGDLSAASTAEPDMISAELVDPPAPLEAQRKGERRGQVGGA